MAGDGFTQAPHAKCVGITDALLVEGLAGRFDHLGGGTGARLADLQVKNLFTGAFAFLGGAHDVHDDERRHLAAVG